MNKIENKIFNEEELFYTPEEIQNMMDEFRKSPIWNLFSSRASSSFKPKLYDLNINMKDFIKSFFDITFDNQDYSVYKNVSNDNFKIISVFDLDLIKSDELSRINLKSYYAEESQKRFLTSFENICIDNNDDILTCCKYVHELSHALIERHNFKTFNFNKELIPILLEIYFAYDIDTDINNYFELTENCLVNKFNPSSVIKYENEDVEYNLSLTKEVINERLIEILCLAKEFNEETDSKKLVEYSKYIKSIIEAINIFDDYVNGNVGIIGYIDDCLAGRINVEEFIELSKENTNNILKK